MKYPARAISITAFAGLFVACAGQIDHAHSQRTDAMEPIRLVCEAVQDDAGYRNHFLRARRIGRSQSTPDGEAWSCVAQHQPAN